METPFDAIVIGGGIAGLSCARQLFAAGLTCQLLEASDQIGGRVRTDIRDGFLLDRGFQVFLTAYPEAKSTLDYAKLKLHRFEPGALIRCNGRFHRFVDPWRRPQHLLATALSPAATLADKLRIARFRRQTTVGELQDIYDRPERTTIELLREQGFSNVILDRFLRPFLGGVFLDRQLQTSSRMCEFVFRMFALGDAALPEKGMEQIPRQLASPLPREAIRTEIAVASIEDQDVVLTSGQRLRARSIIIATEAPVAKKLLGDPTPAEGRSVHCAYFAASKSPVQEPILVLNGDGQGPINNLCVPSQVSPAYAPPGQSLISVTMLGGNPEARVATNDVQTQLVSWFGKAAESWRHLKTYEIKYALPQQTPPTLQPGQKPARVREGLFICGDHCDTASINGAMAAGRRSHGGLEFFPGKRHGMTSKPGKHNIAMQLKNLDRKPPSELRTFRKQAPALGLSFCAAGVGSR